MDYDRYESFGSSVDQVVWTDRTNEDKRRTSGNARRRKNVRRLFPRLFKK